MSDRIPQAWPRGMRLEVAAAYVGLGTTTFLQEVKAAADLAARTGEPPSFPQPVCLAGRCVGWDKDALDAWLDEKFGKEKDDGTGNEWLRRLRDKARPAVSVGRQG